MAKKAAPKSAPAAKPEGAAKVKSATKAEIYGAIAEKTGLGKKDVANVFGADHDRARVVTRRNAPTSVATVKPDDRNPQATTFHTGIAMPIPIQSLYLISASSHFIVLILGVQI